MSFSSAFTAFAAAVAKASGRPITFALSVVIIIAWAATGPIFDYSERV